jgi:osmoprotectant transport system permease protein
MRKEAVSLLGLTALICTFPLPFVSLKPNRVAEGVGYKLWDLSGNAPLIGLVVLVVLFAILIASRGYRSRLLVRSILAAVTIGLALAAVEFCAGVLLTGEDLGAGRAAPGLGFWTASAGAYIILYDSLQRSGAGRGVRTGILVGAVLGYVGVLLLGPAETLGIVQEYNNRQSRFWQELVAHLALSGVSVLGAIVIGIPLGMWAFRNKRMEKPVFSIANGLQTIPSLALFGLLIAPLAFLSRQFPFLRAIGIRGVGSTPAIIALTLYGLLPIIRNTFIGLKSIDLAVVDAGRGMGMSRRELLMMVQVPMALPIILTGVRITAVQTVGNAAVAALIGARGLGNFVFQGLGQAAPDLIVLGVIPIVILAVIVDRGMGSAIQALTPKNRVRIAQ